MTFDRFETHFHSKYSNTRLLDSINDIKTAVDYSIEIGLKGLCLTDHGNICGWVEANQLQQELDDKGIDFKIALGEEGYLIDSREKGLKYYHFIWIAKDKIGAKQIRRISSLANLNSYFDRGMERVPILKSELEEIINENPGHIIATTACISGELSSKILISYTAEKKGDINLFYQTESEIKNFIKWAIDLFKNDFYLEIAPSPNEDQVIVNKRILELSKEYGLRVVIGTDAHYLKKSDRYVHEAFLNSKEGDREVSQFYSYAYLQKQDEILENLKSSVADSYEWLCSSSMEIYNKIEKFSLAHPQKIPSIDVESYPIKFNIDSIIKNNYPILFSLYNSKDDINRYWINKCIDKLKELGKFNKEYLDELEEEADVKRIIGDKLGTNMFAYPIVLSKYINKFWELGSPVGIGRGSACAALNHYLLGVTSLDPIEWNFPFFRYMNRDTDSLGDIDIDLAPSKVGDIIKYIKKERGEKFISNLTDIERESLGAVYVCTFGTESSKSAILSSCRGYRSKECPNGIDVDVAQYISSLVPIERGFVRSIADVYYGNEEKDYKPIKEFVKEVDNYPGLIDLMLGIEGTISRKGRHASGVLLLDEDPYEFMAYMKTPSGEVVTQWDLHMAEWAGATKFDMLVTSVEDKILQTIKLLQQDKIIEPELTLKEAYDKYLHPDILPFNDRSIWSVVQEASTLDLFQLDSDVGRQGARKIKPESIVELSNVNALIRLMTTEKGQESWIDKYVRYKNDKREYFKDIQKYNLTKEELETIKKYTSDTQGLGISQEQLMRTLMDENISSFSLKEANKARKVVSKKRLKEIPLLKDKIFAQTKSEGLANYIWDLVVSPQLSYAFSDIHSISYSCIGFQTAYLATHWDPIYWNTSCLIVNSGSLEEEKESTTDYTKIAKAVAAIKSSGINIKPVDINYSSFGFKPSVQTKSIYFGMKGLLNVGDDVVNEIINNRPYSSFDDFYLRIGKNLNRQSVISLIKGGAFDSFDERKRIMGLYIWFTCDKKKKINLQNMNSLIQNNILPQELGRSKQIYEFTRYLKNECKVLDQNYILDERAVNFLINNYPHLLSENNSYILNIKDWDKIYNQEMDNVRNYLKVHQEETLFNLNKEIFKLDWEKYASGNYSSWEMEVMCFYYHDHELQNVNNKKYGLCNFFNLSESPEIDRVFYKEGKAIPIYKLNRIAGTVIAKNKTKGDVSLLTTNGVVNVWFRKEYFALFDRQISARGIDGKKHIIEKSWFNRGSKILVTGIRRGDEFIPKKYSTTVGHQLYKIDEILDNGDLIIRSERMQGELVDDE